jgi:hypothetical protein
MKILHSSLIVILMGFLGIMWGYELNFIFSFLIGIFLLGWGFCGIILSKIYKMIRKE